MKKLLFLLGILSIAGGCAPVTASEKEPREPFAYVEMGTFAHSFKGNAITAAYGLRKFYEPNLAADHSLFTEFGFNGSFVAAYKFMGLIYLPPIQSTVIPYIGLGGLVGMVSYKDKYKDRFSTICANALAVLGTEINIRGHRQFVSATYHLNSNAILLSVGRIF